MLERHKPLKIRRGLAGPRLVDQGSPSPYGDTITTNAAPDAPSGVPGAPVAGD